MDGLLCLSFRLCFDALLELSYGLLGELLFQFCKIYQVWISSRPWRPRRHGSRLGLEINAQDICRINAGIYFHLFLVRLVLIVVDDYVVEIGGKLVKHESSLVVCPHLVDRDAASL